MRDSDGFQQLNYSMQLSPMKRKNKKRSYSLLRTEESPNFPYFLFGLNKVFYGISFNNFVKYAEFSAS